LLDAGHRVKLVLTQPDRPAGRRRKLTPTPVRQFAADRGLATRTPESLRSSALIADLADLAPEVMVVVDYGLLIPQSLLGLPRLGCINGHASLLPRWRGAAPIERAVLAGDPVTGITVMQMDKGLDTGEILLVHKTPIDPAESAGQLKTRLADICASALVEALEKLAAGVLRPTSQPEGGACYAEKLTAADARLDWHRPAAELDRVVRAFTPRPGAWTVFRGQRLKILEATPLEQPGEGSPGLVLRGGREGLDTATGSGVLRITRLQMPGGRPMDAAAFLNGHHAVGERLGGAES